MSSQKEWDATFMQIAHLMAEKSNCVRLGVGAVITKDNRIVSCGYNGTPKDFDNCSEVCVGLKFDWAQSSASHMHHLFSEQYEIHAEMNAIIDMAKRGLSPVGCTLYTTICPCKNCAKLVIASGIKRIIFDEYYYRDVEDQIKTIHDVENIIKDKNYFKDYNGSDIISILGYKNLIEIEKFKK